MLRLCRFIKVQTFGVKYKESKVVNEQYILIIIDDVNTEGDIGK